MEIATPAPHSSPHYHQLPDQSPPSAGEGERYPLVVHSHLRWDWVWQRPQQFLSRLAARHPVLFVEEPVVVEGLIRPRASLRPAPQHPHIVILTPEFPATLMHDRAARDEAQYQLVREVIATQLPREFRRPVQWFYDPMAVRPFAGRMRERAVVYDCMDQLSQFRGAPSELVEREQQLLALADVVFAGGPKIHAAKRKLNPNCHCYGCGADVSHFRRARLPETEIPADIAAMPGPRLGYFGVVDERMDFDLAAALADAHPEWSVVFVGPWTKIDASDMPQRPNLHWLGGRDYADLPRYAKAFDVCLMPFAINEATEFINPTKALEYMATGRPIVSTAVDDVALQYSGIVQIADSHAEFIAACEAAVQRPDRLSIERGLDLATSHTWESIVKKLESHIDEVLEVRRQLESFAA